ncbi:sulfite exporter TauE/SafE family protein [Francisella frigiditurris]|uniref:Probable membrane transporter protein n=1 Tax=Francisella frigiditurris TaxID=1542390 RepID=A0A1J0KR99_9GAMM|nr:sulfite exporter TauE/SafE family protein [Francisella frigiditurris]APC96277.1 sulfite exporter TauE/SafE family protein [Francisella frigiditurris]
MIFLLGALIGFISSFSSALLGGGSALISIPAFYYIIVNAYNTKAHAMHIAITTVCAVSMVLGLIAFYKHYKVKHITFNEIKSYLIYIALGAFVGAIIVKCLDTASLKNMFAIILFISASWMLFQKDRKAFKSRKVIENGLAGVCGFLSVVVGATTFVTMFFIKIGMEIKRAIAATSFCIFLKSMIAMIVLSYGAHTDVIDTVGYLNIPLLVSAVPFTVFGSLLAVRYLDVISPRILKELLILLMYTSSFAMMI